jgi:hypothetical protein
MLVLFAHAAGCFLRENSNLSKEEEKERENREPIVAT